MQKVYVGPDNTITLNCPSCERTKRVDVSRYLVKEGAARLKYRFSCDRCDCGHKDCEGCKDRQCSLGHTNTVLLERRRQARKAVEFPGILQTAAGQEVAVEILDLSRTSARLRFFPGSMPTSSERLTIAFRLPDKQRTEVSKSGRLGRSAANMAVFLFSPQESFSTADKAIGFFLLG